MGRNSITTFREGDRADTGQRAEYMGLGFVEADFLTEFGYPTQKLVWRGSWNEKHDIEGESERFDRTKRLCMNQ